MSKLTELLKAGDVKYLQRDSWGNNKDYTVILKLDVDNNTVREHVWISRDRAQSPINEVVELSLDEALADDWEIVELDV